MVAKVVRVGRCRKPLTAIATLGGTLAALGLFAGESAALSPGCSQSGQSVSCSVTYTSGSNPFAVPAGVSSIHVVAVGGMGGQAPQSSSQGGHGATVSGDLPVSPGSTVYAVVGGNASGSTPGSGGGGLSGAGGGGGGGSTNGGGGGGASDLRSSPSDLSSRLLVAAGGGGAGGTSFLLGLAGGGGGAAGSDGAAGGSLPGFPPTGGGGGSSATNGGGGGSGKACPSLSPNLPSCTDGLSGGAGGLGVGGTGGVGGVSVNCEGPLPDPCASIGPPITRFTEYGGGGGGGGGGLSGGGGGGGGLSGGGGGGGGSNLVPAGGTASVDTTGVPMVQISYTPPVPTTRAQCLNGGWRNYPQFTNLGECVRFVETGG